MQKAIVTTLIIAGMAVIIYLLVDRWQEGVTIYASTCETASGSPLPSSVCKIIVNYRYQKGD
jgi:hypothetical protein